MNLRVEWLNKALDNFADLYVGASPEEREQMAAGVEALNRRLADNPFEEGESRSGSARVTFVPLLMVRFRIEAAAGVVRVTDVSRYGR